MKIATVVLVSTALVCAANAGAQEFQRFEIFGDYSYVQFNPAITGLQSRALNGGGGGAQFNFGRWFGIKADFQGYGSTNNSVTFTAPVYVTPLIAGGTPVIPAGTFHSRANSFTWMFGPVVNMRTSHFTIFGQYL